MMHENINAQFQTLAHRLSLDMYNIRKYVCMHKYQYIHIYHVCMYFNFHILVFNPLTENCEDEATAPPGLCVVSDLAYAW